MDREAFLKHAPQGWQTLVRELDAALGSRWPNYSILQIKETDGTLRFHAEPNTQTGNIGNTKDVEFHRIIETYEARSSSICELCGQPGTLGDQHGWWSTRCPQCAPQGWISSHYTCNHPLIARDTCNTCGRTGLARLEHSNELLHNIHLEDTCHGTPCPIHNPSTHSMRAYPQHWCSLHNAIERICPHGNGHPDPDNPYLNPTQRVTTHNCDGCCRGTT